VLADLSPLIAATTQWLTRSYPAYGGALASALGEVQARQAVTVAAWLRYPTPTDAALVGIAGPGGSAGLDWLTGADTAEDADEDEAAWRTWVDEVVASWAACLLADDELARRAVAAVAVADHSTGVPIAFRRLVSPDTRDRQAAALLRHPDLLAPVAALHRAALHERLDPGQALIA
jgi:Arc/MetJ family transcription regulator